MAERLTEKDSIENKRYVLNSEDNQIILTSAKLKNGFRKTYYYGKPIEKLAQLEDIMEKYGIESLDILEQELKIAREIERLKDKKVDLNNAIIVFNKDFIKDYIREIEELKTDRDTWKRACELACDDLGLYEDVTTTQLKMKCYYQQAKKDGEQK